MRIGIITRYFHNQNYGGLLQAYALCKYINTHFPEYNAEQIAFNSYPGIIKKLRELCFAPLDRKVLFAKESIHLVLDILKTKLHGNIVYPYTSKRTAAFAEFEKNIPHSAKVYTGCNITDTLSEYDIFITGSDQVWNPLWYYSEYFLDFVPLGTPKISYAASISQAALNPKQRQLFKESLRSYTAISVREKDAAALLENLSDIPVEWVLDPTLLLTKHEWDEICSPNVISKPYIFCYFLGEDMTARNLAKQFADKHKLPLATIPYLQGKYRACDKNFGDICLSDISPNQFISLIKNAEYIFTDSFHATVFSHIFEKEYFVFERHGKQGMSSRLYSLLTIFNKIERFCDNNNKASLSYIESLPVLDYSKKPQELEHMKQISFDFISKSLKGKEV